MYNKSVREHAEKVFPTNINVICKTAHSLAYNEVGKFYRHKFTFNLKPMDIINANLISEFKTSKGTAKREIV